jgi:hypothetical protein
MRVIRAPKGGATIVSRGRDIRHLRSTAHSESSLDFSRRYPTLIVLDPPIEP